MISFNEYIADGKIIDLESSLQYNNFHLSGAINIPFDTLMFNYKNYLNKNEKYYLYCSKGRKSKKAYEILKFYGYNVEQITK